MPDEQSTASVNRELAARIVAAYVRRNQVGSDQIPVLISTVHQALVALGRPGDVFGATHGRILLAMSRCQIKLSAACRTDRS